MTEVIAPTTNGTTGLPPLSPATEQVCLNIADQLEAEAESLASAMRRPSSAKFPPIAPRRVPSRSGRS